MDSVDDKLLTIPKNLNHTEMVIVFTTQDPPDFAKRTLIAARHRKLRRPTNPLQDRQVWPEPCGELVLDYLSDRLIQHVNIDRGKSSSPQANVGPIRDPTLDHWACGLKSPPIEAIPAARATLARDLASLVRSDLGSRGELCIRWDDGDQVLAKASVVERHNRMWCRLGAKFHLNIPFLPIRQGRRAGADSFCVDRPG
jgi:hypothetical protein